MQQVVILDYGSGNLHSAQKAFERAANDNDIAAAITVSDKLDDLEKADRIVLPGVGAFADCRAGLARIDGLTQCLEDQVLEKAKPFLGICVGTQLMCEQGLEKTPSSGFGWVSGKAVKITPDDQNLKIPQIGWNTLEAENEHALLKGIPLGQKGWHAYFVHSYHIAVTNPDELIATTDYGGPVSAIVGRDNLFGTQFHPEKSQKLGLKLIANFLEWKP